MGESSLVSDVHNFLGEFKAQVLLQIDELNLLADGEFQDGFNSTYIDDGWVSMKGYAWGFVVHFDDPVRMDMTFGPDWPFVGHRTVFIAGSSEHRLVWCNSESPSEKYTSAQQLARYGLRRLATKVGDAKVFDQLSPELAYGYGESSYL